MPHTTKVGAVSYLNTKPLVYGLAERAPHVQLVFDLPSRLADRLWAGQLDVALVPVVEYFQHPEYAIVSDACIACRGPVLSVKLFFRVPPADVRTLALDEGSRTSAILAQTLLRVRFGVQPAVQTLPIGAGLADAAADAILLIGDCAIGADAGTFVDIWDLGDVWCRATEQPFVFALWIARAETELHGVSAALELARDAGVARLEQVSARHHQDVSLSQPACLRYLRDNLHFYFGPPERDGLRLFRRQATGWGLLTPRPEQELRFHDCQVA